MTCMRIRLISRRYGSLLAGWRRCRAPVWASRAGLAGVAGPVLLVAPALVLLLRLRQAGCRQLGFDRSRLHCRLSSSNAAPVQPCRWGVSCCLVCLQLAAAICCASRCLITAGVGFEAVAAAGGRAVHAANCRRRRSLAAGSICSSCWRWQRRQGSSRRPFIMLGRTCDGPLPSTCSARRYRRKQPSRPYGWLPAVCCIGTTSSRRWSGALWAPPCLCIVHRGWKARHTRIVHSGCKAGHATRHAVHCSCWPPAEPCSAAAGSSGRCGQPAGGCLQQPPRQRAVVQLQLRHQQRVASLHHKAEASVFPQEYEQPAVDSAVYYDQRTQVPPQNKQRMQTAMLASVVETGTGWA